MDNRMQLLFEDKVFARSGNSLAVKLPALICKTLGISAGGKFACYLLDGDLVFRFPKADKPEEKTADVF
jgi:antitoxin component of MazEF toxin-antitoxin module